MSRYRRMTYEQWYAEVLEIARSWSLVRADVDAISPSWFYGCWERGWQPYDALHAGMVDTGAMGHDGRIHGW